MKIKCIDNKGHFYLTNGATYDAWLTGDDLWSSCDNNCGLSLYHGNLNTSAHGVFEMVEEEKPHPHADLMLKYAMIAQYDDKPWESFECLTTDGEWVGKSPRVNFMPNSKYRLKPQEPKIEVGQTWVSKEGVEVVINAQSNKDTVVFIFDVGGMTHRQLCNFDNFLQNFKLQENK